MVKILSNGSWYDVNDSNWSIVVVDYILQYKYGRINKLCICIDNELLDVEHLKDVLK